MSSLFFNLNLCDFKAGKQVLKRTSFGDESEFVFRDGLDEVIVGDLVNDPPAGFNLRE